MRLLIIVVSLFSLQSHADNYFDTINISGYGTIQTGLMKVEGLNPNLLQFYPESSKLSIEESVLGLQASLKLSDRTKAVVQIQLEGRNDFEFNTEWAYIQHSLNKNYDVSFGKMSMPLFYRSRYRNVNYSHPYSRLPLSVYIGHEFKSISGVSFSAKRFIAGRTLFMRTDVMYGNWSGETYESIRNEYIPARLDNIYSLALEVECTKCSLTVFGGMWKAKPKVAGINSLINDSVSEPVSQYEALLTQKAEVLYEALYVNSGATYKYIGFDWDITLDLNVVGEYANYGLDSSIDSFNSTWYVSGSYRVSKYHTLTYHYERYNQDLDNFKQLSKVTDPILRTIGEQAVRNFAQREFYLNGFDWRYDFDTRTAFKAGYWWGADVRQSVGKMQIFSIGVDFVF